MTPVRLEPAAPLSWVKHSTTEPLHSLIFHVFIDYKIIEPRHEISNNVVFETSKASDQPAHVHSLIRAYDSRLNILWILSYWSDIFGVSKLKRRLDRLVWIYTLQNTTLLEITCRGSIINFELTRVLFPWNFWNVILSIKNGVCRDQLAPQSYKTFFALNTTEHEISTAHTNQNTDK